MERGVIQYRIAKANDLPEIERMCSEHGIAIPSGVVIVAEDTESGLLRGMIGLKKQTHIEPLITGHGIFAKQLYLYAEGFAAAMGETELRCAIKDGAEFEEMYERAGWERVDAGMTIMKKNI